MSRNIVIMVSLSAVIAALSILIIYDNSDEAGFDNYWDRCKAHGGNHEIKPEPHYREIMEKSPAPPQFFEYCDFD